MGAAIGGLHKYTGLQQNGHAKHAVAVPLQYCNGSEAKR